MGADTTTTHLIFFIAGTVVAAAGLSSVVFDLTGKVDAKGRQLGEVITTDIKIANDPGMVPNNPVVIYVKNIGTSTLDASLATLILDGSAVSSTNTVLGSADTWWRPGDVAKLEYAASLAPGDHQARVVTQNGVHDELKFRV